MMASVSLEFLVAVLFIIDLFLVMLLLLFVKRVNRMQRQTVNAREKALAIDAESALAEVSDAAAKASSQSAGEVRQMLKPLVDASREAALDFDQLVREKKKITKDLNEALDSKIISINLLLSRADTLQKKLEAHHDRMARTGMGQPPLSASDTNVLDQQNRIISLYHQKVDVDTIAEQLSIPKGEVKLVIDLKEKFLAMEQA